MATQKFNWKDPVNVTEKYDDKCIEDRDLSNMKSIPLEKQMFSSPEPMTPKQR